MIERFPFEPLIPIIEARYRQPNDGDGVHYSVVGICAKTAAVTGVARGRVQSWHRYGLSLTHADEVACALGLHGGQIWPTQWSATAEEVPQPRRRVTSPAA